MHDIEHLKSILCDNNYKAYYAEYWTNRGRAREHRVQVNSITPRVSLSPTYKVYQ